MSRNRRVLASHLGAFVVTVLSTAIIGTSGSQAAETQAPTARGPVTLDTFHDVARRMNPDCGSNADRRPCSLVLRRR